MDKPAEIEEIQLVAILRVLDCSQDAVTSILHIGKRRVQEIEQWIKAQYLDTIQAVFDDQALKRVVGRELPTFEEMDGKLLIRAGQVTADDILRHYRADWHSETMPNQKHLDNLRDCLSEWDEQVQFASLFQMVFMLYRPDDVTGQILERVADAQGSSTIHLESFKFHAEGGLGPLPPVWPVERDPLFHELKQHLKGTDVLAYADEEKQKWLKYGLGMICLFRDAEHYFASHEASKTVPSNQKVVAAGIRMMLGQWLGCSLLCRGLLTLPQDSFWLDDCCKLGSLSSRIDGFLQSYQSDLPSGVFSSLVDNIWQDPSDKSGLVSKTKETIEQVVLYRETYEKLKSSLSSLMRQPGLPGRCGLCSG